MNPIRLLLGIALSIILAAPLPGCVALVAGAAGAAAGVGTYAYVSGRLEAHLEHPLDRVWEATQTAVEENLEFSVQRADKDAITARMRAKQADGTEIRIDLERQGENLTRIRIRVGVFGDEAKSRLILEKIGEHL